MIKRVLRFAFLLFPALANAQLSDQATWLSLEVKREISRKIDLEISQQIRLDRNSTRLRGSYSNLDLSYKLGNGWQALAEARFSTSARWDRLRYGAGVSKRWKFTGKGKPEMRIRALFQRQFHLLSDPEFGINPPQNNYRIKLGYERKLISKTRFTVFAEPMWRSEAGSTFARRLRLGLQINRSLPGPFSLSLGYVWQRNLNVPRTFHIVQAGLSFNWKRKAKVPAAEQ